MFGGVNLNMVGTGSECLVQPIQLLSLFFTVGRIDLGSF